MAQSSLICLDTSIMLGSDLDPLSCNYNVSGQTA
jgi:hypothetical protein